MAITDIKAYAHLTDEDIDALAAELDAIRAEVEESRGEIETPAIGSRDAIAFCRISAKQACLGFDTRRRSAELSFAQRLQEIAGEGDASSVPCRKPLGDQVIGAALMFSTASISSSSSNGSRASRMLAATRSRIAPTVRHATPSRPAIVVLSVRTASHR